MNTESRPQRLKKLTTVRKSSRLLVLVVIALVVGLLAGRYWAGLAAPSDSDKSAQTDDHQEADHQAESGPQIWTCSMHPQIQQPKPGKCPLCGMDLIPLQTRKIKRTGLRQLVVSPEARALMDIQTTPVEQRFVEAEVRMVGKVVYDETRFKYITAWVSGRLDRLFVDYTGVDVKKGDHMVYIYSEELYAAQQELIESLRTNREHSTTSSFFASGGIDLVESSREKLRLLGLTADQVKTIEQQNKPTDHMTIYAPIGGIVIEKLRQEGDRVHTGDRIYTIADLRQVWVKMDAYESDLIWLRYGQTVMFETEAYPGEKFEGQIAFIDPVLDDKTRTVKVRVNVRNEHGKLKPEMFVRALVRAKVATGGRVLNTRLAGKWMCPMHPEILKDEPGACDICQMPLVRPETLGFVTRNHHEAPLVIPVSATLITGTRAIVYVEVADTKDPTFEGREIVLGPRAGDYYLVRRGLKVGDLVVTNGNFKLDSEVQLQARPSMMTPEGGGTIAELGVVELPLSFRKNLKQLVQSQQKAIAALNAQNLPELRQAFQNAETTLDNMKPDSLEGSARLLWKELVMLMGNDAFEASQVKELLDAKRLVEQFQKNMQRVDAAFHIAKQLKELPTRWNIPPAFQAQLARLWQSYLPIGAALAGDDLQATKQAAAQFGHVLSSIDMKLLSDHETHMAWMKEVENLNKILSALTQAADIEAQRSQFGPLSDVIRVLALQFGFGDTLPVWLLHCPMAFEGKGAIWLQQDDQTQNPYFGGTMLKCADRVEQIAGESGVQGPESKEGK